MKYYSITRIPAKRIAKEQLKARLAAYGKAVLIAIGYIDLGTLVVAAGYFFVDWGDKVPLAFVVAALAIMLVSLGCAISEAARVLNGGTTR